MARQTAKEFSELVLALYEAAESPELWSTFLSRLAVLTGADNSGFTLHNIRARSATAVVHGYDPAELSRYLAYYSSVNPWLPKDDRQPNDGPVVRSEAIVSISDLRQTEFYNDWAKRNNLVYSLIANLSLGSGRFLYLHLDRGERRGEHSAQTEQLLHLLLPHLRLALKHQQLFEKAALLRDAIDDSSTALIVLNGERRVVEITRRAQQLVEERKYLSLSQSGKLLAVQREADYDLESSLFMMSHKQVPRSIAIKFPGHNGPEIIGVLTRLNSRPTTFSRSVIFNLLLIEPFAAASSKMQAMAILFGLTPAEVRIGTALVLTGSLDLAIEQVGVSRNTARSQMASIYQKTGTNRQGQVIQLFSFLGALHPDG